MAITDEIPKSRLTLTYRTTVRGEPEEVTLPFRLLVVGDLSKGTSKDRKLDLDQRLIRGLDGKNLNQVIGDMGISLSLSVRNRIDPERAEDMSVELPIRSLESFKPADIAKNVPRLRALLLLKQLLLEVQANLDNRKEFRRLVRLLATDKAALESITKELKGFETFKLPEAKREGSDN